MLDKKNTLKTFILVMFLIVPFIDGEILAQIILPDDGEVTDVPAAPITQCIGLAIIIGSYLGIKKINDNERKNS